MPGPAILARSSDVGLLCAAMRRRDFLKTPGYFVAVASLSKMGGAGCGDSTPGEGTFHFPQGVASGDPRSTSIVLWTRVERTDRSDDSIAVSVHMAKSDDFAELVLDEQVTVGIESDHTVRMVVTELTPATRYFYRFVAGSDISISGRTLTAPPDGDTAPVRLAWVSCQDYSAGTYGAYRELIKQDESRPADQQIQFVVHLGDFIYETIGGQFQVPLGDDFKPVELRDSQGKLRALEPFPGGGGGTIGEVRFARELADYRHLYKQVMRDPHLAAARARWPFIATWDDHEFSDDSWQTQANYTGESLNEASQARKVAANQAWFEYSPVQLSGSVGVAGVDQAASDFAAVAVEDESYDAVDQNNQVTESNNVKAIASMTIYRSFRYGQNVELVITDGRSYRSDHAVPEDMTDNAVFFHTRHAMPWQLVDIFDQGMTANGGSPPAEVLGFANPRMQSPPGTMLGPDQKQWWKDTMKGSNATWKLWGNQVPLMRLMVKNQPSGVLIYDRVITGDTWDGYNTERKELMGFLRDQGIDNVVVITGDIHAHFAGLVMDDYDADMPRAVAAEFCAAGISSNSQFSFFEEASREFPAELRRLVTYDATALGGSDTFVENLNVLVVHGMASAIEASASNDLDKIHQAADPAVNPHLRYVDTNAQGYGVLTVTPTEVTADLVTINRPITDTGTDGPGIVRTATLTVARDQVASLGEPTVTGTKPFPMA